MKHRRSLREIKSTYRTRTVATRKRAPVASPRAKRDRWIAVEKLSVAGKPMIIRVRNQKELQILRRDDQLYGKFAKHLETEHKGQFVAIGLNGELIVREDMPDAGLAAIAKFGRGQFALRRIGFDAEIVSR